MIPTSGPISACRSIPTHNTELFVLSSLITIAVDLLVQHNSVVLQQFLQPHLSTAHEVGHQLPINDSDGREVGVADMKCASDVITLDKIHVRSLEIDVVFKIVVEVRQLGLCEEQLEEVIVVLEQRKTTD